MIQSEDFKRILVDNSISVSEIVKQYIIFGTPFIFKDDESLYYQLKKKIANHFTISSINSIMVVGSSKLGFSISPLKDFRNIQDDSDIDVAIVDNEIFDNFWERVFEYNIEITSRTEKEDNNYRKFLEYFFKGWMRPDLLPFGFIGKNEWFDFFNSISYKEFDGRKVTAAIYRNEYFFKKYHENNIELLRRKIKNEQR